MPEQTDQDGVSLFLLLWTALDDIFPDAMLLSAILEDPTFSSPPAPIHTHTRMAPTTSPAGAVRQPLASEGEQVYAALLALLDRGLREAERTLDALSFLARHDPSRGSLESKGEGRAEREVGAALRQYQTVKNRLLASSNRRIGACPSLNHAGWLVVGLLVVDAAVKFSLFSSETRPPLLLPEKEEEEEEKEGHGASQRVSDLWERKVEAAIPLSLRGDVHRLRPGDVRSLRTFFR